MQWNCASFNVNLNYLLHEIMEFCVTSLATTENKNIVKLFAISQTIHTVCCEDDYLNYLIVCFTQCTLFALRYLWVVSNEDKCCVVTLCAADICIAWIVYVRTYCVPVATLNQNKRTRFLYLGDAQIIIIYNNFQFEIILNQFETLMVHNLSDSPLPPPNKGDCLREFCI